VSRKPVCYLLNFPRPVGLEPTIYLTKPNIEELQVQGYEDDGLPVSGCFWGPDIEEYYEFSHALNRIMHFNIKLALQEFSVKP
jgi:hypothetical protein